MKADALLYADMATLGRWLRACWRWWIGELASLIPESLRQHGKPPRRIAIHDGSGTLLFLRDGEPEAFVARRAPQSLDLAIARPLALVRETDVPTMSDADLRRFARLDADRLMPLPTRELLVDAVKVGDGDTARGMIASVAAVPRATIDEALLAAQAAGITPKRIGIIEGRDPRAIRFDFAPQLREEGRLPPPSYGAAIWWGLVAAAFLLNLGILVLRDVQSVVRLAETVDAQAPAVAISQTMRQRVARAEMLSQVTSSRRRTHDALGDLGAATAALPDGAWVQRYQWDGRTLRLSGYKQPTIDVVASLRRMPRFGEVRATTADILADIPIGQPFDITTTLRRPRP